MRSKALLLMLLAFALTCSATGQTSVPIEFKGARLGAPISEDSEVWRAITCTASRCQYNGRTANVQLTVAEAPVIAMIVNLDDQNRVADLTLAFDATNFEAVRDAIAAKYPGMKCEQREVQNRMGSRFDQVECRYRDGVGTFTLLKRSGNVDRSVWLMMTHEAVAADKDRAARRKSDL